VVNVTRASGKSKPVVWRWQARFMAEGVEGLTRDKTRKPGKERLPAATVQNVVGLALGPPPGEATHWTGRMLAKATGVRANKHDVVARRKTTWRCQANEVPLRTGSGAIRFAEHLIGGVPDCTQGLDAVLIPVSAKDLDRVKPQALHVDTNTSGQRHLVLCVPL
jgi:hypothetical protein